MKHRIKLTESDLHRIIKESVRCVLNEIGDTDDGQYILGRMEGRQKNRGDFDAAKNTSNYALGQRVSKYKNRTPDNFQDFDRCESSNFYGYRDETDPQLSQNVLGVRNNQSDYERNVRRNYIGRVSKFK